MPGKTNRITYSTGKNLAARPSLFMRVMVAYISFFDSQMLQVRQQERKVFHRVQTQYISNHDEIRADNHH